MTSSPPPLTSSSSSSSEYTPERLQRMLADVITRRFPSADIELLLRAGAEADRAVTRGLRPLHYAAYENDTAAAGLLIDAGARVDAADDLGYTPLHVAAKHGHVDVARTLLDRGAAVNYTYNDDEDETGDRSSTAANSTSSSSTSSSAAAAGEPSSGLLTEQPLQLAIENDRREFAELLLSRGADPNRAYFLGRPINLVPLENVDCLEVLLRHGADPDSFNRAGLMPLMCAVKQQNLEAVRILLLYGADVDAQCPPRFDRRRAINFAVVVGSADITTMLLDAGASIGLAPDYTLTPLDCAVQHDRPEVCRVLLEHGADPNEINEDGCSALQLASSTPNLKHQHSIVGLLLAAGARPNFSSSMFSYIGPSLSSLVEYLTYCESFDYTLVRLFLQYGARVSFCLPTRLLKIRDPGGLLGQLRKLRPHDYLLSLLADAADSFDADAIGRDSSLSNRQRLMLLDQARRPRSLRQLTRRVVLDALPAAAAIHRRSSLPLAGDECSSSSEQTVDTAAASGTAAATELVVSGDNLQPMQCRTSSVVDRLPLPQYLKRYLLFDVC